MLGAARVALSRATEDGDAMCCEHGLSIKDDACDACDFAFLTELARRLRKISIRK